MITYTYYCVTVCMLVVFMKWNNKLYAIGVKEKAQCYHFKEDNHNGRKRFGT